ncbi:helix-turn-helix domain-containing protein [Weizmannia acidilactici]|uniref:helix-turn-helix domain-containing protein n=1 Tax=Weizmannia acidilactici TaxID=2607726 RepID=UPI00124DDBC9|nr:helix-turn-helix domain-containing protein [Weizmannia acidilactici]GER74616.1 hypothetical protein BpPP18_26830 [Weizmannia acidilactici]
MQNFSRKNQTINNVEFVNTQIVADYYGVTQETVIRWVKQGLLSGKQSDVNPDHYLIPKEEFEYLKTKRDQFDTERIIQDLLQDDCTEDWEFELED